jgi:hypothetical protein
MTFDFNIDIWKNTLISLGYLLATLHKESEVSPEIQKWKSDCTYIEIFLEKNKIKKILIFKSGKLYPETYLIPTTQFIKENYNVFRNWQINYILSNN